MEEARLVGRSVSQTAPAAHDVALHGHLPGRLILEAHGQAHLEEHLTPLVQKRRAVSDDLAAVVACRIHAALLTFLQHVGEFHCLALSAVVGEDAVDVLTQACLRWYALRFAKDILPERRSHEHEGTVVSDAPGKQVVAGDDAAHVAEERQGESTFHNLALHEPQVQLPRPHGVRSVALGLGGLDARKGELQHAPFGHGFGHELVARRFVQVDLAGAEQVAAHLVRLGKLVHLGLNLLHMVAHTVAQRRDVAVLERFGNLFEREPHAAQLADHVERGALAERVVPVSARLVGIGGLQDAFCLVETQGLFTHGIEAGHLADAEKGLVAATNLRIAFKVPGQLVELVCHESPFPTLAVAPL